MLAITFNIKNNLKIVGAGYINNDRRTLQIVEFEDNDYFSYLESLIIQISSQEGDAKNFNVQINMPPDDSYSSRVEEIFSNCDVEFLHGNRSDFKTDEVEKYLSSLLENDIKHYETEMSKTLGLSALNAAISVSNLYQELGNHGKYSLEIYPMSQYMRLDTAAINALNLFPQNYNAVNQFITNDVTSIYEIINHTKTSIGSKLLKTWMKQPIRDEKEINRRLDIVEFFIKHSEERATIQDQHLGKIPDVEKLHVKFYKVKNGLPNRANLADCVKAYNMICWFEEVEELLNGLGLDAKHPISENYTQKISEIIKDFSNLKDLIEEGIDINEVASGDYIINPDYSEELKRLYEEIKAKYKEMEQYRDELNEEMKLDKTPIVLVESNSHTYVFEINKKAGDKHIRKSEDYTVVLSKKVYMSFTSPRLENLVDEFRELQESYKVEQDELVLKVLDIVATYFPVIERASNLIAEFDVLLGFSVASTSSSSDYCRPEISSSIEKLNLTNSRHPLIERINPQGCISNDCNMVRGLSNLQLITGPNMGGKSTYIRQIAINVLLAHIGCFVPCESAEIPILDAIIARVGASDHQLKGVSTFMAEMLEAAWLLKSATQDSLIIMDELGRGTSTSEGFGLAWAIAEYLANDINCYSFFATHFHELTSIDKEVKNAKNYYVDVLAKEGELTMLYKVKAGVIDRSYGIHVAEMLKFPQEIIDEAQFISNQLEGH